MLDSSKVILTDDNGQEYEMEIILTFEDETTKKNYVLVQNSNDIEAEVFAYTYDENGNMNAITNEEEYNMCAEVLGAFQEDNDEEDN